jgi:hypothetical protein
MDRSTAMHNESVLTMFDPMTHTPGRYVAFFLAVAGVLITDSLHSQSGLGDHGLEGFEDFIKCHKCTSICLSMELCKLSVLTDTIHGIRLGDELEADSDAAA